jgi:hypothetical protein
MRLAAIYNLWADWEFLKYSLKNITPLVDGVIIIGSNRSNYGEISLIPEWVLQHPQFYLREPQFRGPRESETDKRNYGLLKAKQLGYTHFLTLDADELYIPENFLKAKERILNENLAGLVCPTRVYFGSPNLTIGFDGTRVPFIHVLKNAVHGINKRYPHAWDSRIRVDPTRQLNINSGVEYTEDVICEHYSWCRGDYQKKIRNSTARTNLERSCILNDLVNSKEGYFCEYYQKTLVRASVDFEIPEYEFNQSSNTAVR